MHRRDMDRHLTYDKTALVWMQHPLRLVDRAGQLLSLAKHWLTVLGIWHGYFYLRKTGTSAFAHRTPCTTDLAAHLQTIHFFVCEFVDSHLLDFHADATRSHGLVHLGEPQFVLASEA